jgi:hypothetical protein
MFKAVLRFVLVKKPPKYVEPPTKSFAEIFREMMELDNKPLNGFAFVHPILAYSYDFRKGRKVMTNKGIGTIVNFYQQEYRIDIHLDKQKYIISRHPNDVSIIVVLGMDGKFKPLTFHDWKYVLPLSNRISFPVEYRHTTHGNYCLTNNFKNKCQQLKS